MGQIHFNFILISKPTTHVPSTWLHPLDRQGDEFMTTQYWAYMAKVLERGRFDAMFFADTFAVDAKNVEHHLGFGSAPKIDPWAIVPAMADATKHVGFGVTLSTAGMPPYLAVRKVGTYDNLSNGRVAWNVVTTYVPSDFLALGIEPPPHDERYDRADEYMEICKLLWDAFPHDAVLRDRKSGVYVDMSKVKKVSYAGKYYKCEGYSPISCSIQGRPLIYQAGASGRGIQFAATHADAIFALQPDIPAMKKYVSQVNDAAATLNRPKPKVYLGLQPFLGGTEAEARQRFESLRDLIDLEVTLPRMNAMLGTSFTAADADKPLGNITGGLSQGLTKALMQWERDKPLTVREAAVHVGMASTMPQFIGTPEKLADEIERIFKETGCHGFVISPNISPLSVEEFVDHVVPILQRRGLMRREYSGVTLRDNVYKD